MPYSDALRLNILELKKSDLATEEDKKWKLDIWARFFKCRTWEEVAMLAKELPILDEAAETIIKLSTTETFRDMCFAREEYLRNENTNIKLMAQKDSQLAEKDNKIAEMGNLLAEKDDQLAEKDLLLQKAYTALRELGVDPDSI